jgi:hypothetical protein
MMLWYNLNLTVIELLYSRVSEVSPSEEINLELTEFHHHQKF